MGASDVFLDDFVGLDDSVVETEPGLSVDEIVESLQDSTDVISLDDDENGEYETDEDECMQKPKTTLFVETDGIRSSIVNVSKSIEKEMPNQLRLLFTITSTKIEKLYCYHSE